MRVLGGYEKVLKTQLHITHQLKSLSFTYLLLSLFPLHSGLLCNHILGNALEFSGIVPDGLKISRVIPLFKSENRSLFTNYRPVSVLPAFSSSTYPTNRIIILQKRLVHIISNQSFDAHTAPLFRELKILRFTDIFLFQLGKFMYLFKLGLLPEIFNGLFFTIIRWTRIILESQDF